MTPDAFISKWSASALRERQGAQEHFIDLCRLLGKKTPAEGDPSGESYCFERGATKVGGGDGWADVWKRGCFGIEYKGKHKDLGAALRQLQIYAPDLENPPYLVVCDMERIVVHTNWTNAIRKTYEFGFGDLRKPVELDRLRLVFEGSEALKPGLSPQALTQIVAERFGDLGKQLQERGHDPRAVAHFLNRIIFCLFAEDAELLPKGLFERLIVQLSRVHYNVAAKAAKQLDALFAVMAEGGFFGADELKWFNGGLFDAATALPLERDDLDLIAKTAKEHDWSNIDPAVFGTMFEAALKTTGRRAALGAHYTDREKIFKIVDPVIVRPLQAEWAIALAAIEAAAATMAEAEAERRTVQEEGAAVLARDADAYRAGEATRRKILTAIARKRDAALRGATEQRDAFLSRLAAFRVLDPACGSGNFLYVALHALRDLELRAILDADRLGVPSVPLRVGLDAIHGIEIEPYAAELARVTLWIGNLQWERRNGDRDPKEPVLSALKTIEPRDALLNEDGSEADWPMADVIVGNPPFLGGSKLREKFGAKKLNELWTIFGGRVRGRSDLYTYWFEKANDLVASGAVSRVGLIAKNTFTQSSNRSVLEKISNPGYLFDVHKRVPWMQEGAQVEVHLICFGTNFIERRINQKKVDRINNMLEAADKTIVAATLKENLGKSSTGATRNGPFDIDGVTAREILRLPKNVNGRPNSDVVRPYINGNDLVKLRPRDRWLLYFGTGHDEEEVAQYEKPFSIARERVFPARSLNNNKILRERWWEFERPRPLLQAALRSSDKYIAISEKSEHFVWRIVDARILPDNRLIVCLKSDFVTFGILQSAYHRIWASAHGSLLQDRPCYTASSTFETFPFPFGLAPATPSDNYAHDPHAITIGAAATKLDRLRETWLNPPDLVRIEPEVVPGYPDRILPKDEAAAAILKKRTLTNLYNERPTWLTNAHRALDEAVAAAYGWPADLSDEKILARLFALNQERAAAGR